MLGPLLEGVIGLKIIEKVLDDDDRCQCNKCNHRFVRDCDGGDDGERKVCKCCCRGAKKQ